MPGIYGWRTNGVMNLEIRPYLVEASQTIYAGDLVVLVKEASNYNQARVKKLTQTEISADYTDTTVRGILGWATHDIVTTSTGAISQLVPSTIAGGSNAIYALPGYAEGIARMSGVSEGSEAEDKGNALLNVALFNNNTEVLMRACTSSDDTTANSDTAATVDVTYLGVSAGVQIVDSSLNFALNLSDTGGDDSCFIITGVEPNEPTYATSSKLTKVWAKLKPTLQQQVTGIPYAN